MVNVPKCPKIYHITHVRNLAQIVAAGRIWSDAKRIELGLECAVVGMSQIKKRRLEELPVKCHQGTLVGHYVPFYFCPRSIMLFILYSANHPELTYRGGQGPIVHLEADLGKVVKYLDGRSVRWAFSTSNAGARYASFYKSLDDLKEIDWSAVQANVFRDAQVKDGKQAEYLAYESFPWKLVERVGVQNQKVLDQVHAAIADATHQPLVELKRDWYF